MVYKFTQCFQVIHVKNDKKHQIIPQFCYLQQIKCPVGFEFKFYENDVCIAESKNGIVNFTTIENKETMFEQDLQTRIPFKNLYGDNYYIEFNENNNILRISVLFTYANSLSCHDGLAYLSWHVNN